MSADLIRRPYLVFLGDVVRPEAAKTAFGLRDWAREATIAQWRLPGCGVDLGIPECTPAEAVAKGAQSMVIGIAPVGGAIPEHWTANLLEALESGLDLVSGLHVRLADMPAVAAAADRLGRRLHDVRHSARAFPIATGRRRSGRRLLTVGTDCALGKKYTALAIAQALRARGVDADFRATGQTGIMIAGSGVAIDAVVSDFIAGAAETLSPDAGPDHWDIIEGQGSLFHPSYAGVTLGLIHGSQPDAMVLCHDPGRTAIWSHPDFPLPTLRTAVQRYEEAAQLTNLAARVVGVSLDTSKLEVSASASVLARTADELGLPCFDPMRSDLAAFLDGLVGQ